MTFILIDRRKASRGKSSSNRQKLIKRIKSYIKSAHPQNIGTFSTGGVGGTPTGGQGASPVKVAGTALEEPYFAYARNGDQTLILIGNKEYDRGDEIEIESEEDGGSKGGPGDAGEDEFIINIARDEFLDYFFEDCELPNLVNEKYTEKLDNKFQKAGFSTTGSPSQLSIIRTYKQALGRQMAMSEPVEEEKKELEEELATIIASGLKDVVTIERAEWIVCRLKELDAELSFIDGFDTVDLRYRKREAKPLKTVDAVLIMIMDISGSMDEMKKTIARRWFALLYAFIKRRYGTTELVFIAHTDEPFEMSENDFFSTRVNGGTTVSPALKMADTIIKERYDPNETNIYISHASDGDNWETDNSVVIDEMIGSDNLMNKIQLFSYVEVGKPSNNPWHILQSSSDESHEDTGLWKAYDHVRDKVSEKKITLSIIETPDDCYPIFKKVFRKSK